MSRLGIKYCPISGNQPIRMTESAFKVSCKKFQVNAAHYTAPYSDYCQICKGHEIPAEIEFIDLRKMTEEKTMPKAENGKCDLCGNKKTVRHVREKSCCATCEHIWRAVNINIELIITAINAAHGDDYLRKRFGSDADVVADNREYIAELEQKNIAISKHNSELLSEIEEKTELIGNLQVQVREEQERFDELLNSDHIDGPVASSADALLDLALDVLDGTVVGLTAERIRALR